MVKMMVLRLQADMSEIGAEEPVFYAFRSHLCRFVLPECLIFWLNGRMRNQRVTPFAGPHAWRAPAAGAALALPVLLSFFASPSLADDSAPAKGGRLHTEVLQASPHQAQLTAPHLSIDWWHRIKHDVSDGPEPQGSRQVFVRREERR